MHMIYRAFYCALLFMPILLQGQSVKIFAEKKVDWDSYQSFTVADGELITVLKNEVDEKKLLAEVRETIISELTDRGLKHVTEGGDLRIDFTGEVVETTNVQEIGPLGQAPADEPGEMDQSRVWTQERKEGSLGIELFDARSSKSLWRSTATIEFGAEELAVIFNAAVGRSFRKFPLKK
jgi:hypothetical protein